MREVFPDLAVQDWRTADMILLCLPWSPLVSRASSWLGPQKPTLGLLAKAKEVISDHQCITEAKLSPTIGGQKCATLAELGVGVSSLWRFFVAVVVVEVLARGSLMDIGLFSGCIGILAFRCVSGAVLTPEVRNRTVS